MENNQKQKAGDNSQQIQADLIVVNQGIDEKKLLTGYKVRKIEELTLLQYKEVVDNQKAMKERFGV